MKEWALNLLARFRYCEWKFEPKDVWIGLYWEPDHGVTTLYICIVPCFPIIIEYRSE